MPPNAANRHSYREVFLKSPLRTRDDIALLRAVSRSVIEKTDEYLRCRRECGTAADYYRFAAEQEPHDADEVFSALRWGGQFLYASRDAKMVRESAADFARRGFTVTHKPSHIWKGFWGIPIPLISSKIHYFVARKTALLRPREITDRFTYNVELVRESAVPGGYCVLKEVPSVERVIQRLEHRFPDIAPDILLKRARKFTDKIFPLFLTREAAMLQILQRDLPPQYSHRVPRLLGVEKDDRGYVRKMRMTWLRNGGLPISQAQFAAQSAELLNALHDEAGVIHLDLRLDNFVITPGGVGFVDFGSAVRVGEDLHSNTLLSTLFEELLRTSEIQRMLERMTQSGFVTSPIISQGYHRADKAVDFFYLAVQINTPLKNPDFHGLVEYDPKSREASRIRQITDEVLRPRDVNNPRFRNVRDMMYEIHDIGQ